MQCQLNNQSTNNYFYNGKQVWWDTLQVWHFSLHRIFSQSYSYLHAQFVNFGRDQIYFYISYEFDTNIFPFMWNDIFWLDNSA